MKMGIWLSPHFYSDSSSSFLGLPSGKMIN